MRSIKDKAIIIRRKPFGEADLLLTLYTEKNGKVKVVAKGARKITSKLLGFTELFTSITCQIDFKSSIPIVSQVSHDQLFDGIASNQQLYTRLHIVAELIDKGCKEQEVDLLLFRTLQEGMQRLIASNHPLLVSGLILRVSTILGFDPELTACAHCGEAIDVTQPIGWSHKHGGVVSFPAEAGSSTDLTINDLKVLRYLRKSSFRDIEKLSVPTEFAVGLEDRLLGYVQYVLEEDFVTQRVRRG